VGSNDHLHEGFEIGVVEEQIFERRLKAKRIGLGTWRFRLVAMAEPALQQRHDCRYVVLGTRFGQEVLKILPPE
jgi:hypothetical protein